ncbi:MAG: hypothetical protein V4478_00240 [Patescibacteria group bacterium]
MTKETKIAEAKAKISKWIANMNGSYDHVMSDKGLGVNIKDYFPHTQAPFGCFIYKMYDNKIELAMPDGIRYSFIDTPASIQTISYEQLTDADATMLHNFVFK